ILTTYIGGEEGAGAKLKEVGTKNWYSPNLGANNESYFSALPGGWRDFELMFDKIHEYAYWWSQTEYNTERAYGRYVYYYDKNVYRQNFNKKDGFSVRCLQD
ncbi:MAG: FISUMP domain-containing protein, partial [Bacteroidales bacterium]